jgi:NCS1 family nucleobase:cation symporter-1
MHTAHTAMVDRDPALYNEDLAPVPGERRTWGIYSYCSLWVAMSVCIPTYMLASGLIAGGMNWWQAVGTILLGNLIVLAPMVLNAHAGTKYGIPFPVFVRASFGVRGANLPAVLRALVACGWFGIQTWIGGTALFAVIGALLLTLTGGNDAWVNAPSFQVLMGGEFPWTAWLGGQAVNSMAAILWPSLEKSQISVWVCFFAFWLLNMAVIWRGIDTIRFLEGVGAPFMLGVGLLLLWWITRKAGGLGPVLHAPGKFHDPWSFLRFFVPSLTAMVGFWATVALNIPDFTRYARSQKAQMAGQAMGLPAAMTLYSFIGVAVTSASVVLFGEPVWDPVVLIGRFHEPGVALVALVAILIATLNTNVAANVVSPSNDFSNLRPQLISFRTGGLITGVLGVLMMPWKLLGDYGAYIFGWLVGYSGLLGPVAGVMIADYFIVRRRILVVDDLYRRGGAYEYRGGVNPLAIVSLTVGVAVALMGLVVPGLRWLYDYAWFVGFGVAGLVYVILMRNRE